jgi:hypothetical protein
LQGSHVSGAPRLETRLGAALVMREPLEAKMKKEQGAERVCVTFDHNRLRHPRFYPGALYITRGAQEELPREEVISALSRHVRGDWGDLYPEDMEQNELAVAKGEGRLFSLYRSAETGKSFYIITEPDRTCTTVLLPSEY